MRIGFLVGGQLGNLKETVKWASAHDFKALEINARPGSPLIDPEKILKRGVGEVKDALKGSDIIISCLTWCPNNLDPNIEVRKRNNEHIIKMIKVAAKLEVPVISTWIGKVPGSIENNMKVYSEVWPSIVECAEKFDVKIAIENCMGNIAYSPYIWEKMFKIIPSKHLGLNFDPSHLVFQFIDYLDAIRKFGDRIYHTHCKDTEILWWKLSWMGYTGKEWWRFRIPGLGDIDWKRFISALQDQGYDYALSIEHEDPIYSGTEGFKKGLIIGLKHLSQLLP
ncbi:TPA: sugar phosphate isomerase/epimerase [Candidatus Bathyarchaeota archaeon]|nr:sugar phosphate isomerase/epimerase [Candidatus Bathyarchaeota archaeon]